MENTKDQQQSTGNIINNHNTQIYIIGANQKQYQPTTSSRFKKENEQKNYDSPLQSPNSSEMNYLVSKKLEMEDIKLKSASGDISSDDIGPRLEGSSIPLSPMANKGGFFEKSGQLSVEGSGSKELLKKEEEEEDQVKKEDMYGGLLKLNHIPERREKSDSEVSYSEGLSNHQSLYSMPSMASIRDDNKSVFRKICCCLKREEKKIGFGLKRSDSIKFVGDSIKKRSDIKLSKVKHTQNKLIATIAKQAIVGKNPVISKIFQNALLKVNPEKLEVAKKRYSQKRARAWKRLKKKIKKRFKSLSGPFLPDSEFIIFWKCIVSCSILVQAFLGTYIITFRENDLAFDEPIVLATFICDILFAIDVFFNFHTAFYRQGELIIDRKKIVKQYFKNFFFFDMLTLISFLAYFIGETRDLSILNVLRVYHLKVYTSKIEDYFQFSRQMSSIVALLKLLIFVLMIAHFIACFLFVVTISEVQPDNWLTYGGIVDDQQVDIYISSLYWAITVMVTVGYGDFVPITRREKILHIFIMIVSSVMFGYILSSIGSLIIEISNYSSESREKMRLISKYMSDKGLPKETQSRIKKYLEYYLDKEHTKKQSGNDILHFLSDNLKEEIIKEVNAKVLYDTNMFSVNFRRNFLYIISRCFNERTFGPDEVIYNFQDEDDKSVYFVTSGSVEVFYEKCEVTLARIYKGGCFGGVEFFADRQRSSSVKSCEFTTLFQLTREAFLEKIDEHPIDKETYRMIVDDMNIYKSNQYLDIDCYGCGSKQHIALDCPQIHGKYNKQKVIQNFQKKEESFRKKFKRRVRKYFHAFIDYDVIQEGITQAQMNFEKELELGENYIVEDPDDEYSDTDEILDNNLYDPLPIEYFDEQGNEKYFDPINDKKWKKKINQNNKDSFYKTRKRALDEHDIFVMKNYDPLCHNINIDMVRNFEVYNPNNNIAKMAVEMDMQRVQRVLAMKVKFKAKHILPLLIKGFKLYDTGHNRDNMNQSAFQEQEDDDEASVKEEQTPGLNDRKRRKNEQLLKKGSSMERSKTIQGNPFDGRKKLRNSLSNSASRRESFYQMEDNMNNSGISNASKKKSGFGNNNKRFGRAGTIRPNLNNDSDDSEESVGREGFDDDDQSIGGESRSRRGSQISVLSALEGGDKQQNNDRRKSQRISSIKTPTNKKNGSINEVDFGAFLKMDKISKKLEENKSPMGSPTVLGGKRNAKLDIYGQPDLTRKILKDTSRKSKSRYGRSGSLDSHKRIENIVNKLDLENVVKGYVGKSISNLFQQ